jgi:hypothetical protein
LDFFLFNLEDEEEANEIEWSNIARIGASKVPRARE